MQRTAFYDGNGIIFGQWTSALQKSRTITSHAMMMVGEQKKQIESLIQEEAEELCKILEAYEGKPVDPLTDIKTSIVNIISVLVVKA